MTIRELTQTLNEIPAEFMDMEVEFGSQLTSRDGDMIWLDQAITAVYANPDRGEVVLCSRDVGRFLADGDKAIFLRLIPVLKSK